MTTTNLTYMASGPAPNILYWRPVWPQTGAGGGGGGGRSRAEQKARRRRDPEAERAKWLGLKVVPKVVAETAAPAPAAIKRPGSAFEAQSVISMGVRTRVKASPQYGHTSSNQLPLATQAQSSVEIHHDSAKMPITMSVDQSKVVSHTTVAGGGGFKFGSKHVVETDLWLDRPITEEEREAVFKRLKP